MSDRVAAKTRRATAVKGTFFFLAAAGFVLYLFAALRAPVVVYSDSRVDLALASAPWGFLGAASPSDLGGAHTVKPGFVLFLAGCSLFFRDPARASVVIQSLFLCGSIVVAAALVLHRRRGASAIAFLAIAIG